MGEVRASGRDALGSKEQRMAFVLIDGLADIQIPALANMTPLEAAHTPALDAIAGLGLRMHFWRLLLLLTAPKKALLRSCWLQWSDGPC